MEFRKNNVKKLRQEIQKIFNLKTAEFLEKLLNNYEVPSGKIRTIPEAVTEEQFLARKLWNKVTDIFDTKVRSVTNYFDGLGEKINIFGENSQIRKRVV